MIKKVFRAFLLGASLAASTTVAARALDLSASTLDATGNTGHYPSIAIDRDGVLHAAYFDTGSLQVRYTSAAAAAGWSSDSPVEDALNPAGVSLAVGVDGARHIAFNSITAPCAALCYARSDDGLSWSVQSADPAAGGYANAIALNGAGNPLIAYVGGAGELKLARYDGSSWSLETVDAAADLVPVLGGEEDYLRLFSLALDGAGNPRIAYYDANAAALRYIEHDGGSWATAETVDATGATMWAGVSLALDGGGIPHVAYNDFNNGALRYATRAGGAWSAASAFTGALFYASELVLDGDGNPLTPFNDDAATNLGVAWHDGVVWSSAAVGTDADAAGSFLTLALAADGEPHILYSQYQSATSKLKYASATAAGFTAPMGGNARSKVQAPYGFTGGAVNGSQIQWSWTDNSANELGFELYGAPSSTGPFTLIVDTNTLGPGTVSYTESDLGGNTSFYRYVAAVNAGGVVVSSGHVAMTEPALVPPGHAASTFTNIAVTSFTVNWTSGTEAGGFNPATKSYDLRVSTAADFSALAFSSQTLNLSAVVTGLVMDTIYYVQVAAFDGGSTSAYTDYGSLLTLSPVLAVPSPLVGAVLGVSSISWTWGNIADEAGFRVVDDADVNVSGDLAADVLSFTETALSTNTRHSRRVAAFAGKSVSTSTAGAVYTLAAPPTGFAFVEVYFTSATVLWAANTNPADTTTYRVDRWEAGGATTSVTVNLTSATLTGLSGWTTYYLTVAALNGDLAETASGLELAAATLMIPPGPAASTFTQVAVTSFTVNWASGTQAGGYNAADNSYRVEVSTAADFSIVNFSSETRNLSAGFTGLSPDTTYYVRAAAFTGASASTYTDFGPAATLSPALAVPSPFAGAVLGISSISWTWGNIADESGFRVVDDGGGNISGDLAADVLAFTETSLSTNTRYSRRVAAFAGKSVSTSAAGAVYTLAAPPTGFAFVEVYFTSATVRWAANTNPADTTTYRVDRWEAGGATTSVTVNLTSATLTGLSGWTTYYLTVAALNGDLAETASGLELAAATLMIPPGPAASTFTQVAVTSFTVNWASGTQAGGYNAADNSYRVEASTAADFSVVNFSSETRNLSAGFTGLSPDTTYYVRAAAFTGASASTYADFGPAATLSPALAVPSPFAGAVLGISSISWTWGNIADESGFRVVDDADANVSGDLPADALAFAEISLSTNTRYSRRVAAFAGKSVSTSAAGAVYTLAAPPTGFAFVEVHVTSMTVLWAANTNPADTTTYRVDRWEAGGATTSVTVAAMSAALTGLSEETRHYLTVHALNGAAVLTASGLELSTMTLRRPLLPPGHAASTLTNVATTSFTVSWTSGTQAGGYNREGTDYVVQTSTAPDFSVVNFSSETLNLSAVFTGLEFGVTYYLQVAAFAGAATSAFTNLGSTMTPLLVLDAPSPFAGAVLGVSSITWTWGNIADEAGFRVVSPTDVDLSGGLAADVLSFTETDLSTNTLYDRRAVAFNGKAISTSAAGAVYTLAAPPTGFAFVEVYFTSATVRWAANTNPADTTIYRVDRWEAGGATTSMTANLTSATLTGLLGATTYYMTVTALNGDSVETASGLELAAATLMIPPGPAASTFTQVAVTSFTVNWASGTQAGGYNAADNSYRVEVSTAPDFSVVNFSSETRNLSAGFTGLSPDTTYYVRAAAFTGASASTYADFGPVATLSPALAVPSPLAGAVLGVSSINWTWGNIADEAGFRVVDDADANVSGDLPADALAFAEISLSTNTRYRRRVAAFAGKSVSTSAAGAVYTLAAPPTGFAFVEVYFTSATVRWAANTNPADTTTYRVDRWEAGGATTSVTVNLTGATLTGFVERTTYYLTVAALNGDGVETASGLEISTATAVNPAAVRTVGAGGGTVVFQPPSGAVTLGIPPGAFTETVTLTVVTPASFPGSASATTGLQGTGVGIEISLDRPAQPARGVTIQIFYRDSDVAGMPESELLIARYDEFRGVWVPLLSTVDPGANSVAGITNHFSVFQVMRAAPGDLSAFRAFPNPLRPALGHRSMMFANLPAFARIRIYTPLGELVMNLAANASGIAAWDGANQAGSKAGSGAYFVFVEDAGKTRILGVAVQR